MKAQFACFQSFRAALKETHIFVICNLAIMDGWMNRWTLSRALCFMEYQTLSRRPDKFAERSQFFLNYCWVGLGNLRAPVRKLPFLNMSVFSASFVLFFTVTALSWIFLPLLTCSMMMTLIIMMMTAIIKMMMTLKFSISPWPICRPQAEAKYLHGGLWRGCGDNGHNIWWWWWWW